MSLRVELKKKYVEPKNLPFTPLGVLFYPSHVKSVFSRIFTTTSFNSSQTSVSKDVISQMTGIPPDSIVVVSGYGEII